MCLEWWVCVCVREREGGMCMCGKGGRVSLCEEEGVFMSEHFWAVVFVRSLGWYNGGVSGLWWQWTRLTCISQGSSWELSGAPVPGHPLFTQTWDTITFVSLLSPLRIVQECNCSTQGISPGSQSIRHLQWNGNLAWSYSHVTRGKWIVAPTHSQVK